MCTLLTVNQDLFMQDPKAIRQRILSDSRYNSDGWSLVCVDPLALNLDMHLQTMSVAQILNMVDFFMSACSPYGRIFLHSRAATTQFTGVAFNHGFSDFRGTLIQHNGVIHNYRDLGVDSFNLVDYNLNSAMALRDDLETAMEGWANIFLIRPNDNSYGVVRMSGGTLYTDMEGNYSTNPVGDITRALGENAAREHQIMPTSQRGVIHSPMTQTMVDQLAHPEEDEYSFDTPYRSDLAWDAVVNKRIKIG